MLGYLLLVICYWLLVIDWFIARALSGVEVSGVEVSGVEVSGVEVLGEASGVLHFIR